ncbi:hypothetical protein CRYUN_Cryun37aG0035200 [Craigia yunnanensis]
MASQSIAHKAGEMTEAQTGEQVKHIAQEAADAVKSTLGMNSADNASNTPNRKPTGTANPSTNHPSNPSPRT